jgi:hypothetical protein
MTTDFYDGMKKSPKLTAKLGGSMKRIPFFFHYRKESLRSCAVHSNVVQASMALKVNPVWWAMKWKAPGRGVP